MTNILTVYIPVIKDTVIPTTTTINTAVKLYHTYDRVYNLLIGFLQEI